MKNVLLWAGAGQIGMAITRRVGTGMKIVVGDKKIENAQAMAKLMNEAGTEGRRFSSVTACPVRGPFCPTGRTRRILRWNRGRSQSLPCI